MKKLVYPLLFITLVTFIGSVGYSATSGGGSSSCSGSNVATCLSCCSSQLASTTKKCTQGWWNKFLNWFCAGTEVQLCVAAANKEASTCETNCHTDYQ